MTLALAFYKGRAGSFGKRAADTAIRFSTRGKYSHVELIPGAACFIKDQLCLSSSGRDGGVREKRMRLKPSQWDLVELDIPSDAPATFIRDRIGAPYDYAGIVFSQLFALARHDASRWFCSEICAAALGLPNPQRVSPQFLFDVLTWRV